jgi:hypothetical protein
VVGDEFDAVAHRHPQAAAHSIAGRRGRKSQNATGSAIGETGACHADQDMQASRRPVNRQ